MEEALIADEPSIRAHQAAAEVLQPREGARDDPAASIATACPSLLGRRPRTPGAMGGNAFEPAARQARAARIAVIPFVRDHAMGRGAWPTWTGSGPLYLRERLLGRGSRQEAAERHPLAVDQDHPRRALATLGLPDREPPVFAGAKLPSRKVSSQSSRPCASKSARRARQARSQTPVSSPCCRRRQQVLPLGTRSRTSRQRAPVRSPQRLPSKQVR